MNGFDVATGTPEAKKPTPLPRLEKDRIAFFIINTTKATSCNEAPTTKARGQ
jgi:hypothetical protein